MTTADDLNARELARVSGTAAPAAAPPTTAADPAQPPGGPAPSERAIQAIIGFEVTSPAYYQAHYQHPKWPGGASGVTVGIGYDLGTVFPAQFRADWSDVLPTATVDLLAKVVGKSGAAAQAALPSVAAAVVPLDAAMAVFRKRTVPEFTRQTLAAFPGCGALPADCFGVLVSLVYNRGTSMTGDRRSEMRAIRSAIAAGRPQDVPAQVRAMKRLWPGANERGLRDRREAEAQLFEDGLRAAGA
ncbi:conserved protein of unknown function (plasmid) [Rhodovastum atsumiense]|uniref:hypothetical protein n=1 Tax=Rhodovastum atsumiense TaxID=504468 RepID=UPI002025947D|nr:hypothetical protein [Rhodovastum atsumiense]CAH2606127.1 conserved protein of unknown function [Rhodovastum atsumiense]